MDVLPIRLRHRPGAGGERCTLRPLGLWWPVGLLVLSYHRDPRSRDYQIWKLLTREAQAVPNGPDRSPTAPTLPTWPSVGRPGVWTAGTSTVARPPSLQRQLLLRAAHLFPRETTLGPGPRGCGSHSDGVLLGHMLSTLSSGLRRRKCPQSVRDLPAWGQNTSPQLRPGWLHSCPKCPVLAPGRRVFHHTETLSHSRG